MVSTSEVRKAIDDRFGCEETFEEMANNERIKSKEKAYNYDEIKRSIMGDKCSSADSLLIKKNVYFIEFKTGFENRKEDVNIKTHKENLKCRIRLKAYESLALFEKVILADVGDGKLWNTIKRHYIAVIDTTDSPKQAYEDLLRAKSGKEDTRSQMEKDLFENSLLNYRKETKDGRKVFFDETKVWYDYEFDSKVVTMK